MILLFIALASAQVEQPSPTPAPAPTSATNNAAPSPEGFVIGVDTVATVTTKLGQPQNMSSSSDGNTTLIYLSNKAHVKAATFIPFVGGFVGGAKGHQTTKIFIFGRDGALLSYSTNASNVDCNLHFAGYGCH